MNVPIIKLEVSAMKHTILTALQEHAALMDSSIQAAVEEFCRPDNIDFIVRQQAKQALECAVKDEVRNYFRRFNENGRLAVREAVIAYLDEQFPVNREGEK